MKESQHIEWKEAWRDEYLMWLCGFANAEGGVLVIGRNDKGEAVGVKDAPRLLQEIPNKVRDILGIMVDVNLIEEAGKEILEIVVEPYPSPVSYKGDYHYRRGSTKQELKGAAFNGSFRSEAMLPKQGAQPESRPETGPESISLEMRVLALLASTGPMSKSALSAVLGQKEVSGHLNQLMRRLVTDQWVAYTIPDKPQSRLQKYRLTAEGRVRLMENGK